MSTLYPRLLDTAAKSRYEELAALDLPALRISAATRHPAAIFAATGGTRVTDKRLTELQGAVRQLADEFGYPTALGRRRVSEFDVRLAELLHREMDVVAAEAAVRPMWAFLALVVLPDVAYWRFPERHADRVLASDITRHVFGRVWWRAHLLHDSTADDPYHLVGVFGEAEFDHIFGRRRAIGGSRAVIRAIAQHFPSADRAGHADREVLRETLKVLARRGAFQDFESHDHDDVVREIADVVRLQVEALTAACGS